VLGPALGLIPSEAPAILLGRPGLRGRHRQAGPAVRPARPLGINLDMLLTACCGALLPG
jgi:hypothetical protein